MPTISPALLHSVRQPAVSKSADAFASASRPSKPEVAGRSQRAKFEHPTDKPFQAALAAEKKSNEPPTSPSHGEVSSQPASEADADHQEPADTTVASDPELNPENAAGSGGNQTSQPETIGQQSSENGSHSNGAASVEGSAISSNGGRANVPLQELITTKLESAARAAEATSSQTGPVHEHLQAPSATTQHGSAQNLQPQQANASELDGIEVSQRPVGQTAAQLTTSQVLGRRTRQPSSGVQASNSVSSTAVANLTTPSTKPEMAESSAPNQNTAQPPTRSAQTASDPANISSNQTGSFALTDADHTISPAAARAHQIDSAMKLEQATGQATPTEQAPIHAAARAVSTHGNQQSGSAQLTATLHDLAGQPAHDDNPDVAPQVIRGLSAMVNQRGGVMSMRLDPPELGEVRVQMTLARGVVAAEFQAGTQHTQLLLEKSIAALRTALEHQGLTVDKLIVHAGPSNHNQHGMRSDANNDGSQQLASNERHDAANGQSRGRNDREWPDAPFLRREIDFDELFASDQTHDLTRQPGLAGLS